MISTSRLAVSHQSKHSLYKITSRNFGVNPNEIAKRIASTKSIQKITKSMKMVSAAKLRGDTQRLLKSRTFGAGLTQVLDTTDLREGEVAYEFKKPLYVMITTDRGLCGGVNGYVAKKVKLHVDEDTGAGLSPKVFIVGDKGAPLMLRTHGSNVLGSVTEPFKFPMNFPKAMAITERILNLAEEEGSDVVRICYNRYINSINYETSVKDLPLFTKLIKGENAGETVDLPVPLNRYEIEYESTSEAVSNIMEYALSVQLYGCALENATSEQSSRMTAMDNASKNASELVEALTVKFNRARQAKITTELTEIISGAESLKG